MKVHGSKRLVSYYDKLINLDYEVCCLLFCMQVCKDYVEMSEQPPEVDEELYSRQAAVSGGIEGRKREKREREREREKLKYCFLSKSTYTITNTHNLDAPYDILGGDTK